MPCSCLCGNVFTVSKTAWSFSEGIILCITLTAREDTRCVPKPCNWRFICLWFRLQMLRDLLPPHPPSGTRIFILFSFFFLVLSLLGYWANWNCTDDLQIQYYWLFFLQSYDSTMFFFEWWNIKGDNLQFWAQLTLNPLLFAYMTPWFHALFWFLIPSSSPVIC